MKLSNIWKAYKSTILGVALSTFTSLTQALQQGNVNWNAIVVSAAISVLLAITDVLKETIQDKKLEMKNKE